MAVAGGRRWRRAAGRERDRRESVELALAQRVVVLPSFRRNPSGACRSRSGRESPRVRAMFRLSAGAADHISATVADMCGEAIDVPLIDWYVPLFQDDRTYTPEPRCSA